jgi:hypothetical protein
MSYGARRSVIASSFSGVPAIIRVIASYPTSRIFASKIDASSVTCDRASAVPLIVTSISSRSTASESASSLILITGMSLLSCLVICSSGDSSTLTTIVIRDMSFCSVAPTASDWML